MYYKNEKIFLSLIIMFKTAIEYLLKNRLAALVFFFIIGFILYGQTLKFGYTDLDDSILIQENSSFLEKGANAGKVFTQSVFNIRPEDRDNYYRPLLIASFMLDAHLAERSLLVYHASNIIFHVAASFLLLIVLLKLNYKKELAFIFSLLFLCHPVFTTAVAWIPGRNDSLLAIFILGALISLIHHFEKPTRWNLFFHHLLFLLCLFTKETAIVLPVLFFSFIVFISKDTLLNKKNIAFDFKRTRSMNFILGWMVSITVYEFMRHAALANADSISGEHLSKVFKTSMPTIIQYIGKLIFPFNLSTYPVMEDTTYLYGLLSLVLIFVFIFLKRIKSTRYYWSGLICFILFLLPAGFIQENALEHRLYIPAIGFSLMCLETDLFNKIEFDKGIGRWILLFILALFSGMTILNTKNYRDEISFWAQAVKTSPHCARAHMQIGSYYQMDGKIDEAEKEYKTAIALKPDMPNVHNNLGKVYIQKNMLDEAEKQLSMELKIKPNAVAYYNLAIVKEDKNDFESAKTLLNRSIELKPDYADALVDLAILYAREQKYDEALDLCLKTIQYDPANKLAYKNTALIYLVKKQFPKAKEYYLKSRQMGVDMNLPMLDTLKVRNIQ